MQITRIRIAREHDCCGEPTITLISRAPCRVFGLSSSSMTLHIRLHGRQPLQACRHPQNMEHTTLSKSSSLVHDVGVTFLSREILLDQISDPVARLYLCFDPIVSPFSRELFQDARKTPIAQLSPRRIPATSRTTSVSR